MRRRLRSGFGPESTVRRALRVADDVGARLAAPRAQRALEDRRPGQQELWRRRSGEAQQQLDRWQAPGDAPDRTPAWIGYEAELERLVRAGLPWDVLRRPILQGTMLVRGAPTLWSELALLRSTRSPDELGSLLGEDPAGCPPPARRASWTSPTAVHQLYHLERLRARTGTDPFAASTVVEWGGGYGAMGRLLQRGSTGSLSHVIVDLPAVLALQWTWLGTVLGPDAVHVLGPGERPRPGRVSLTTPGNLDGVPAAPDLFVSTWALSEMPATTSSLVARPLAEAAHVLLAGQEPDELFPGSAWPLEAAVAAGATLEAVGVIQGSQYALR